MRDLCRILFLVGALGLSTAALAQCTRDTDCKGDRVCDQGVCVDPSQRQGGGELSPPPPPPPPPREEVRRPPSRRPPADDGGSVSAGWTHADRPNLLVTHPLTTVGALILGQPAIILVLPAEYERAITPNVGLYGQLSVLFGTGAAGSAFGLGILGGVRFYFFGDAPAGFYGSGALGAGSGGFLFTLGAGYTWIFDGGFTIGVGGTINPLAIVAGFFPIGINCPIGFNF